MAKRGRKPKERKGYFYELEEQAIIDYINETDMVKRNKIFNTILYPALTKMIESIIRRYKLFIPDEEFDENFYDTFSYLISKIDHFKPIIVGYDEVTSKRELNNNEFQEMSVEDFKQKVRNAQEEDPKYIKVEYFVDDEIVDEITDESEKNTEESDEAPLYRYYKKVEHKYKAYSYCGTICKNYLMYKSTQYDKKRKRSLPYDDALDEISNSTRFSIDEEDSNDFAERLLNNIANEIDNMIEDASKHNLNENEIKVGRALVTLIRNWEDVLPNQGSNKLQKSSVLYFLREETMMSTKEVRDNMKKYKTAYQLIKKMTME